jgi:hexulose-6-phosphate isomerase
VQFEVVHEFDIPLDALELAVISPDLFLELGKRLASIESVAQKEHSLADGRLERLWSYQAHVKIPAFAARYVTPEMCAWDEKSTYDIKRHVSEWLITPHIKPEWQKHFAASGTYTLAALGSGRTKRTVAGSRAAHRELRRAQEAHPRDPRGVGTDGDRSRRAPGRGATAAHRVSANRERFDDLDAPRRSVSSAATRRVPLEHDHPTARGRAVMLGIMQGRLAAPEGPLYQCFPRTAWETEFERAARAGLDAIEWIYDVYGADVNPIATAAGLARMRTLSEEHGIAVRSVCADYFMERPFVRCSESELRERIQTLTWLLGQCHQLGMQRVVLPFVDASKLETAEEITSLVKTLTSMLPVATETGVELHLETDLDPRRFAALLELVPSTMIWVNYDSGNSSGLGYAPREEFAAYGARVGSVHIKDRVLGGTTVALGTGSADFPALFESLANHGYDRDFILQAARLELGSEVELARANRAFVERLRAAPAVAGAST